MVYVITWSVVLLASASAVAAFLWSLQHGQLQRLEEGARVIFDHEDQQTPPAGRGRQDEEAASGAAAAGETDQFPRA